MLHFSVFERCAPVLEVEAFSGMQSQGCVLWGYVFCHMSLTMMQLLSAAWLLATGEH